MIILSWLYSNLLGLDSPFMFQAYFNVLSSLRQPLLNSAIDGVWSQQTEKLVTKATDSQFVFHTKLQLSQAADGFQTRIYEDRRPRLKEPGIRSFGMEERFPVKRLRAGQRNLVLSLLDLMRSFVVWTGSILFIHSTCIL